MEQASPADDLNMEGMMKAISSINLNEY